MSQFFRAARVSCEMPSAHGPQAVFSNLDFTAQRGEIIDLTGPSGVGKSTLLMAFARLSPYCTGELFLEGRNSLDYTPQQWRSRVSYLPQVPVLVGTSVADAIRSPWKFAVRRPAFSGSSCGQRLHLWLNSLRGASQHCGYGPDDETIRCTLDSLGCNDIELERPPHDLSGGQAARVSLCRTLLTDPQLILADEVDAGLDDDNATKVGETMRNASLRGTTIIRVRHRPADGLANRIVTLTSDGLS